MADIIDLSDDDDCVLQSVIEAKVSNEVRLELYNEVYKTNQHLADFIEKCLCLENTIWMLKTLKDDLLKKYYQLEKSVQESPKIQKAIRRANNLLNAEPRLKHCHIKDLCEILKASKVKKKVPFITLTTNLKDNNSEDHNLKRSNTTQINATSWKKPKLDSNADLDEISTPFMETAISVNFNDTTDTLDDSMAIENCSQESATTEEDNFLVPQTSVSVAPQTLTNEERIKKLERRLAYYQKEIARLDELEVDDDSVNSPYIKSERLKSAIVVIYKELCQLMGSQTVKRKEIRLRVVTGHPPGPTRILETFLNNNIGSDGQPPFPDFCDVVNCVTEANEQDDLGWTKCQIMKEAGMLFTQCGRALQKRRQNREYRDLLCKVKKEDCQIDPADNDPELLARLQENKRIAIKKESDILERYTMMESLPSKPKVQKNGALIENTENEKINKPTTKQEELNHNNNCIIDAKHRVNDECKNSQDITSRETTNNNDRNINDKIGDESNNSIDVASRNDEDRKAIEENSNDKNNENEGVINFVSKESHDRHNIEKTAPEVKDNVDNKIEEITNFVPNTANEADSNKIVNNDDEITKTVFMDTDVQNDNNGQEKGINAINSLRADSSIKIDRLSNNDNLKESESNDFKASAIKQEPEEELSCLLEKLGDDYTFVIETIENPTITIEISDSSDDELDK